MSGLRGVWQASSLNWWSLAGTGLVAGIGLCIALLPLTWAVLLVLGSAVALVTLVRPQLGVVLVALAVPFGSLRQVRLGVINVGVTESLVALVLAAWLMRRLARRDLSLQLPALTLPLVLFSAVLCLSALGSASLQHSIKELVKWLEVLALYVLVANEISGPWKRVLVFVLLGTGALAAVQGVLQFLFQLGPEEFILFGRFMRAYGTFEQPNPYAGYLGLTLPVAVGLMCAGLVPRGKRVPAKWLIWAGGTGALMVAGLVMSWSRGAWLGAAAGGSVVVIAIVARSGRAAVLGLFLVLLLAFVASATGLSLLPPSVVQRFSDFGPYLGVMDVRGMEVTDANYAVLERMAHWQSAIEMWTDHPWLGVGIGNYEVAYSQYALPQWSLPLGHAHNYYLNIAAEAGLVGLIVYVCLWAAALLQNWRVARIARGWTWGVALGVLGVLVHLSVHNVFDNLFVHAMYLQVAILLGMIAFETTPPTVNRRGDRPRLFGGSTCFE